jgi:hypothetical protein
MSHLIQFTGVGQFIELRYAQGGPKQLVDVIYKVGDLAPKVAQEATLPQGLAGHPAAR